MEVGEKGHPKKGVNGRSKHTCLGERETVKLGPSNPTGGIVFKPEATQTTGRRHEKAFVGGLNRTCLALSLGKYTEPGDEMKRPTNLRTGQGPLSGIMGGSHSGEKNQIYKLHVERPKKNKREGKHVKTHGNWEFAGQKTRSQGEIDH